MAGREDVRKEVETLMGGGKLREAAELLERALQAEGRWAEGALLLAKVYGRMGRIEDGVGACRRALVFQPDLDAAQGVLGALLLAQGKLPQALEAFRSAVQREPGNAAWMQGMGRAYAMSGKLREAKEAFQRALNAAPVWADVRVDLGRTLEDMGDLAGARAAYTSATQLDPKVSETWHRLGVVVGKLGQLEAAAELLAKAAELDPQNAGALFDLGVAYEKSDRDDLAGAAFERVLALRPGDLSAIDALGRSLRRRGKLVEALAWFRRGLEIDAGNVACHSWLGLTLLLMGQWEEGWREYEWRWKSPTFPIKKYPGPKPEWNGEEIGGKVVLVYTEQGFGDAIQFARYVPLVAGRGGRVVVVAQRELVRLMECVEGVERVVERAAAPGAFDWTAPMMTLPRLFGSRVGNVPGNGYLRVPAEIRETWGQRVTERMGTAAGGAARVGIIWGGRPEHENDKRRSFPAALFAKLGCVPGVQLASLQMGEAAKQLAELPAGERPIDLVEGVGDFLDSAGLIEQLDLVIGVDTAPLHLAGALGKPVWMVLPPLPDWRWLMEGETTMWYPTMRLFRQGAAESKADVMGRVEVALREWAGNRGGRG